MAQFLPGPEKIKAAQDEALKLFDAAVQEACKDIDKIQENSKQQMEQVHSEFTGAGKNLQAQLAGIHEQTMIEIGELQKATENRVLSIWETAQGKMCALAQTLSDPDKKKAQLDEIIKHIGGKIKEINQTINKHAEEVKKQQKIYFNDMQKRASK